MQTGGGALAKRLAIPPYAGQVAMKALKAGRNANAVAEAPADAARVSPTARVTTPRSAEYLEAVATNIAALPMAEVTRRVEALVADHEAWRRGRCLNLNAAENAMSRRARRLLDSDLATRVTEGFPGDKEFPPAAQNVHTDELEAIIITLARRLFEAEHVEWRPVSTSMALATVLFALSRPGDGVLAQAMEAGANMAYHADGTAGLRGLRVHDMPWTADFGIDVDLVREQARALRPRFLIVGGSYVLFAYPLQHLRAIADEVGAMLVYDAAHVALLIAAGRFQHPLREGADLIVLSTHKIMGGPVGGLVLTNRAELARPILGATFPGFLQTRDQNKYAATACALAEAAEFGRDYAAQMITNAQALAAALEDEGFHVIGRERGFTDTHQLFLDVRGIAEARELESRWQMANILVHAAHLPGDTERGRRTGIRISVQEVTRQGLEVANMPAIARWMRRVGLERESPEPVAAEIVELLKEHRRILFSFDD